LTPLDEEVVRRLRKSGKPILLAVNKVDTSRADVGLADFARLGLDIVFPVSAIHGEGISELVNGALKFLPEGGLPKDEGEPPVKLAIVGRPNVGKSSIINALTRSQRVVVSPIPGTTRDAVDVPFEVETEGVRQRYLLIDTAGVRQERRVDNSIEFYSVKRTDEAIERADVVVFVIDAESGITGQDKKIGGKIIEARKACIVVVNKWDLVAEDVQKVREEEIDRRVSKNRGKEKQASTLAEFGAWVQKNLFFLDYAPVIFTSAKSGFHLDRLLEAVRYVTAQLQQQIPTSLLNRTLNDAIEQRQPVSAQGHRLKFFYATQVRKAPPTFLLFVNRDELFSDPYNKYLASQMRRAFGYEGCPIILVPKPRPKTIETIRKHKPDTRRPSMAKRDRREQRAPKKFRRH
jgi:GTP-binding protein